MTTVSTESRVPLAERNEVPVEVAILYDKLLADRGVVPNMFKALSNVPDLVLGIAAFLRGLMGEGSLHGWYKELIATRVASLNDCEYCVSAHRYLAAQRGAKPEQVAAYDSYETGPFTEKEKAGFRYADLLHLPATRSTTLLLPPSARTSIRRRSSNLPRWLQRSSSSRA